MIDGSLHLTRMAALRVSTMLCTLLVGGCSSLAPVSLSCGPDGAALETSCDAEDVAATIGPKQDKKTSAELAKKAPDAQPVIVAQESPAGGILSQNLTDKLARVGKGEMIPRPRAGSPLSLADVVRNAIRSSAQVGLATAARSETEAGVDAARAAYRPVFDLNSGSGQNTFGTLMTKGKTNYFSRENTAGAWRSDFRVVGSLMVYDFGAIDADVARAMSARDAAALREAAAAEEAAFTAAQLYVRVLQSRELLALADENLAALKVIAKLISTNVQNGNATQADIQRVEARVLDGESARADQELQLKSATEQFIRNVNLQPGELRPPPSFDNALPASVERGLEEALRRNPMIIANAAVVASARAEAAALKATNLPRISLDTSAQTKTYRGNTNKTELDLSAMVSLSYRLADGGLNAAKGEQAAARLTQAQIRDLDTRESLELDLRQQFLQYSSAKAKREGLLAGVKTSANARELYQEQFIGGKRTLLELLEVQNAYYSARFNSIVNASDLRLSTFSILRSTGRLSSTILGSG